MKKRGLSKRILAFVLSVMMVLALVPVNSLTVYADDDTCEHCGGTGVVCYTHRFDCECDNEEHCWYGACVGEIERQCTTTNHMNGVLSYQCRYCKGSGRKSGNHEHTYSSYVYNEGISNPSSGFYCHTSVCGFDGCDNTYDGYCDNIGGICSVCGHDSSSKHIHSQGTHHEAKAASCVDGNIEYWDCSCGAKLDNDCNVISDETIPAVEEVKLCLVDGNPEGLEGDYDYKNVFDGSTDTKWSFYTPNARGDFYVVLKANYPINLTDYTIYTAADEEYSLADRKPKSWEIWACNDYNEETKSGSWEVLDAIGDGGLPNSNATAKKFYINSNSPEKRYQYFMWYIRYVQERPILEASEFEISYTLHSFECIDAETHKCLSCGYVENHNSTDGNLTCSYCGYNYATHFHSKGVQHTICVNGNNIEYWKCAGCDKYIDENLHEIEDINALTPTVTFTAIDGSDALTINELYPNLLDGNTDTKWRSNFNGSAFLQ